MIELPLLFFQEQESFRTWMSENYHSTTGIWLRMYKLKSGVESLRYEEALDVALCFGWIDGQNKSYDALSFIQKFTPRRKDSLWSKRNIEHIERLTRAGLLHASGLAEVQRAKDDGRWERAYDSMSTMTVPDFFLAELAKNKEAELFFNTLNKTNIFAIVWRLQTAKNPIILDKRMNLILSKLERKEKFHP